MPPPEVDVVVVGAGGSGLAAAVAAAQAGALVLVLEKREQPGGTTGIAVGSFTAAETSLQKRAHLADSVEDHVDDAGKFAEQEIESRNADELRAFFLGEAAATLDWLQEMGLTFVGPHPEPPNRMPRMHNVVPGAKAYIAALQLELRKHHGQLVCNATVTELVRKDRRIDGVRVEINGTQHEIRARRGVVLAAGDYANNPSLIADHKGAEYQDVEGINPFALGEGHTLASDVGAKLVNMDVTYGPELRFVPSSRRPFQQWLPTSGVAATVMGAVAGRLPAWILRRMIKRLLVTWQHPENSLFDDGAILLNERGERFVNETVWPDRELAVAGQPNKVAYLLLDGELVKRYSAWPHFISTAPDIAYAYVADYLRLRPDVARQRESLADLCAERDLPLANVEQAIALLNDSVSANQPGPFDRVDLRPLNSGPWALLGPVKAYFTTTEGGAAINTQMQVLDQHGDVIPGLYAVGQNGLGGMILFGHGLHIAWAMTSGRLVGQQIMQATDDS